MIILDLDKINSQLDTSLIGCADGVPNELWQTIDSTNSRAGELASQETPQGVLVIAREQTAGRGRLGRTWVSKPDTGIYMSILLRPEGKPLTELSLLTMGCGVAVSKAIETACGAKIGLKWVNDLVFAGRKIGGILAETVSAAPSYIIVGIGLNVALKVDDASLPEQLQGKIDSLDLISGQEIDSNKLVCAIAREIEIVYTALVSGCFREQNDCGDAFSDVLLADWRQRSVTLGQDVIAQIGHRTVSGFARDVSASGALIIELEDGTVEEINAGEVQIRRKDGAYC